MDAFDHHILRALQNNSRISSEALGAEIGLSPSACQRRIKKLKQQGVIKQEVAVLDAAQLPGFITTLVDITLERGGETALDEFIRALEAEPQVQQFYYVAGDVDFVVIVVTQDMKAYDALSRRLFMSNQNIKKFSTKVVIQPGKVGLELPV
ncbi:Lrp/AsnC family transcriptional regulator [Vibrio coralliilyticus]|uniref:Lrp/AsnC family transcriptional regulator n=1 Tax=Vibrio coralliilyticus TaxID=190893 RepID=UPI00155F9D34|nr:Lrp/AsnC family transcriptional regulator [Vibrio coralliilyticus]NRF29856.1 Lrp/AsnC family transcriptional regulator [Vibrio coralliilyticus]NRF51336.1 Lrp/AsnC family transcriptional regulator [Vibrio coralliilyticus]NRG04167.1 Lrp/AsnC family transcriptional regulator [Vibrio coralliilyticus]